MTRRPEPAPDHQPAPEPGGHHLEQAPPPIPAHLHQRPTVGGLVVPAPTPRTLDGRYLFGKLTDQTQRRLLRQRRCQICDRPLPGTAVFFVRPADVLLWCTSEPGLCPPCAAYSSAACPMLSGRMRRYRTSEHPSLAGIASGPDSDARRGAPAEPWFTLWVPGYDVITHPMQPKVLAASWLRTGILAIRPVLRPAAGRDEAER